MPPSSDYAAKPSSGPTAAIRAVQSGLLTQPPFANPMTSAGDLIVGGSGGTPTRLGKGADGQVLHVDPVTHLLSWADGTHALPAGGATGEALTKNSGTDYDVGWAAGGVSWPLTHSADETFRPNGVAVDALTLHNTPGVDTGFKMESGVGEAHLKVSTTSLVMQAGGATYVVSSLGECDLIDGGGNSFVSGSLRISGFATGGGSRLSAGSGAPTHSEAAGGYYFRTDTPGTSLQQIYVSLGGGSWTGIV